MYVQSGIQNLNQQKDFGTRREKAPLESKDFDEVMQSVRKKRPVADSQPSRVQKSKDKDNHSELGDGENLESEPIAHSKKQEQKISEGDDRINPEKNEKVLTQKLIAPKPVNSMESDEVSLTKYKNMEPTLNEVEQPLSTNSSDVSKITLEENQKKIQQLEKTFSEIMNQTKNQNQVSEPKVMFAQAMPQSEDGISGLTNMKPFSKEGQIKIDSDMTLNNKIETLEALNGQNDSLKTIIDTADEGDSDGELASFDQLISQQSEVQNKNEAPTSTFADELTLAQNNGKSEKIENMQSIIKQARAVVDDGGGSMEIHLQPEGLGKVHLKVAVNDGRVNVEMMADNHLAKKALEEGVLEMKQALESHKLLVQTVKVEMSPDYQKDFSDLQNHMQEQENRNFAEQFLGQFQRERDERLGGMFDSFRNFQPESRGPELSLGQRNHYAENGKGRSINLVA